jgi:hypothetical protein
VTQARPFLDDGARQDPRVARQEELVREEHGAVGRDRRGLLPLELGLARRRSTYRAERWR